MRRLLPFLLLICALSAHATTYYLAPTGSDSNSGTSSSSPWLTPNHAVNCGDVLSAAAGTYANTSFEHGNWGVVTATGHCVAIIVCAQFDACIVTGSGQPTIWPTASHWGIMGFDISKNGSSNNYGCIQITPPSGVLTDFLFANNVIHDCYGAAINPGANDYVVAISNTAYNAAQQSSECASGFAFFTPANYDTLPGTHIYIAQNFAWGNVDANPCDGTAPTDGEGFTMDTWSANSYTGQGVIADNIAFFNGSAGFEAVQNTAGAHIYFENNTSASNSTQAARDSAVCGEFITYAGFPATSR